MKPDLIRRFYKDRGKENLKMLEFTIMMHRMENLCTICSINNSGNQSLNDPIL